MAASADDGVDLLQDLPGMTRRLSGFGSGPHTFGTPCKGDAVAHRLAAHPLQHAPGGALGSGSDGRATSLAGQAPC